VPAGRRRRLETPVNACQRSAATPSNDQQRPATPSYAQQRNKPPRSEKQVQKERLAGPTAPARQRQPSNGPRASVTNQCRSENHRPRPRQRAFVTLAGTKFVGAVQRRRWARRCGGDRPGGCLGQGTAQNHRAILSRPRSVRDPIRRPSQSQPFAELRDFSLTWRQGGSINLDGPGPRQAMPDSCKTRSARDHLLAVYRSSLDPPEACRAFFSEWMEAPVVANVAGVREQARAGLVDSEALSSPRTTNSR